MAARSWKASVTFPVERFVERRFSFKTDMGSRFNLKGKRGVGVIGISTRNVEAGPGFPGLVSIRLSCFLPPYASVVVRSPGLLQP